MKEKIKELKELGIAYKCALEFDHCPDGTEADYIIENIVDYNKNELIEILDRYEGFNTTDIESSVFLLIDSL